MKEFFSLLLCALLLCSCSLFDEESEPSKAQQPAPVIVSTVAYKLIDEGDYQGAYDRLEKELNKNPIGPQTVTHQYAIGLALMGLGRFDEAIERFEIVIRQTEKTDNQMFTEALYQRGKAFEAVDQDGKALAAYLDVLSRKKFLRQEVAEIEVPVRIAGVYMRQRLPQQANKFYQKADKTFERLRRSESSQNWMPRALFGMGKASPREVSPEDFRTGLVAFRRAQGYLVKCMELNRAPWSARASHELQWILESAWKVIENEKAEQGDDPVAAMRLQQEKRIEMGLILDGAISAIKKEFLPGLSDKSPHVIQFQQFLVGFENRLDALVSSRPVQEGLTPEAKKRQGLVREGKVVDPEGRLEVKKKTKGSKGRK